MTAATLEIAAVDPHSAEAIGLTRALSDELARRYDFTDDGVGDFAPEDAAGPGGGFVVGRLAGRPVACGAFRRLDADAAEVKRMYVVPDCRGRGFAAAILAEVERLAGAAGYAAARLETGERQPEAIRLYERSGYRRIPNFGYYADDPRSVCFEKRLAPSGAT